MTDDIVLVEKQDKVATVTLNRPQAFNSLSMALMKTLRETVITLASDNDVHVIIIAANGRGFCAGHDLKEITAGRESEDKGKAFFEATMQACSELMLSIVQCPKPVIAQVHGIATAAGCQLVASCDLAVATESARFATPGVNIGLFCSTPMVALSRNVSSKQAMKMLLTGDMIPAEEALAVGLINDVVAEEDLADSVMTLARKIADKAPATLRIGKEAFYRQKELSLEDAYQYASEVMVANMLAPDAAEGIGAFVEKRHPVWRKLDDA